MSTDTKTITISVETQNKLKSLRFKNESDEDLISKVVDFACHYKKSWESFVLKTDPKFDFSLVSILIKRRTLRRLEEERQEGEIFDDIIRRLLNRYSKWWFK